MRHRYPERRPAEERLEADPLRCVHCGEPISAGELFIPAGRCPMGGVVVGPTSALYEDALEPAGEHLRCAAGAVETGGPCTTIGHGTRSVEDFVALLNENGIELVADIRTVPKSRHNPQSAGEALANSLRAAGVGYVHLPGLGGFRKPRADSPNSGWRNLSFRGYADYMLTPEFEKALAELMELLQLFRTALMCSETVYWRCHRSLVADALLVRGVESRHLLEPGKVAPHTLTRFARPEGTRLFYPSTDA